MEEWNGVSWAEVADLSSGRNNARGTGSSAAALVFGGGTPSGNIALTEEWSGSSVTTKTVSTD